jgi:glycosyltransferase involved in cell wall biosynthesis
MHIVMVGPFGLETRGTMSVRALPMANALVARGYNVTMLLPPWRKPEQAGRRWEENGVAIETIILPPGIPGLFHALTAARLARRALTLDPDVVHLFKPKAYSGLTHWLLRWLPRSRRPRLVVDTDDWEGPGGWNALGDYSWAQRRFFTWQERWGLTHADAVTVASHTLESLVWAMGVPPTGVFYVPNGVTPAAESRKQNGDGDGEAGPPCILLYTRFFEFPVSRVIELLRRVREQVPAARVLVVGKGFSGEEDDLLHRAHEAGFSIEDRAASNSQRVPRFKADVTYAGWVPAEALPPYFARADVAIYPFDDTLVNRAKCAVKLLDLLAAGVPVVAEAVGQNRAYVRHGETGWLVPPGDVDAFAAAVSRLLKDTALRERLGQAAARDVRERFTWNRLVTTVEQAYGANR